MLEELLKNKGLKVTAPRLKVLKALSESKECHFTAERIYDHLKAASEEVPVATVYRVLTQLVSAGLVIRHNFEGGSAVYELDEGRHHDHLICVSCGKVIEFVDPEIEKRQIQIAAKFNFLMQDHSLTIYGRCRSCA